jgi:hypothetical protein
MDEDRYKTLCLNLYNDYYKYNGNNDIEVLLNMWTSFAYNMQNFEIPRYKSVNYCNDNKLNHKKISEILKNIKTTCNVILTDYKIPIVVGAFSLENVTRELIPIIRQSHQDYIVNSIPNKKGTYMNKKGDYFILDTRIQNLLTENPTATNEIIALNTYEVPGFRGNKGKNYITLYLPLSGDLIYKSQKEQNLDKDDSYNMDQESYNAIPFDTTLIQPIGNGPVDTLNSLPAINQPPVLPVQSPPYLPSSPKYLPSSPKYLPPSNILSVPSHPQIIIKRSEPQTIIQPPQTIIQPPQTIIQPPRTIIQPPQTIIQPPQTIIQSQSLKLVDIINNIKPITNSNALFNIK